MRRELIGRLAADAFHHAVVFLCSRVNILNALSSLRLSLQEHQPAVWLQLLLKLCASSDLEVCRRQAQQRLAAHPAGRESVTAAWCQQIPWQ
jgi:hypothetical protein